MKIKSLTVDREIILGGAVSETRGLGILMVAVLFIIEVGVFKARKLF